MRIEMERSPLNVGGGDGAVEVVDGTSAGSSRSAPGMSPVVLLDLLL